MMGYNLFDPCTPLCVGGGGGGGERDVAPW